MCVAKIMDTDVKAVQLDDRISVVKQMFEQYHCHHLPVLDKGEIVGIVSERSLLSAISPFLDSPAETTRDIATLNKRVHQIMRRDIPIIYAEASIYEAIELFSNNRLTCVPVQNNAKQLVGIVSWHDVLNVVARYISKARKKAVCHTA